VTPDQHEGTWFGCGPGTNESPHGPSFREPPNPNPSPTGRAWGWFTLVTSVSGVVLVFIALIVFSG